FTSCRVAEMLQKVVMEGLQTNGINDLGVQEAERSAPTTNTVVRADVRDVKFVQGPKREMVAAQMDVRFRVLDGTGEHCLYDRDFLIRSQFNEMKAYQGEAGRALFRREITDAVHSGVEQFLRDARATSSP